MSENMTLIIGIPFLIAFWAAVIWLFASKPGNTILRVVGCGIVLSALAVGLYLHWEPYVAMVCLTVGFVVGVLFAEWHYDIKGLTALRSDLQRQRQLLEREDRFQQAQRPWLDSERDELTYRSGPAAKPRG